MDSDSSGAVELSSDDERFSSDNEDRKLMKRKRRNENIYGVFLDHDEAPRRKRSQRKVAAPLFVKQSQVDEPSSSSSSSSSVDGTEQVPSRTPPPRQPDPEQQAADDYFLHLLQKGKGRRRATLVQTTNNVSKHDSQSGATNRNNETLGPSGGAGLGFAPDSGQSQEQPPHSAGLGFSQSSGLGFGRSQAPTSSGLGFAKSTTESSASGLGFTSGGYNDQGDGSQATLSNANLPSSFGNQPPPPKRKDWDPSLGKWEKHTKGIGMKLLSKMGYKGSGGLNQDKGLAKPINVKVRPSNLGLGFGNFKEAKQSSAPVKPKGEESKTQVPEVHHMKSAIPNTDTIFQQQSWRRKKTNKSKNFVPYTEVLKQPTAKVEIIDMTGQSESQPSEPQLGEELLHNVTVNLHTYETRVRTANDFLNNYHRHSESIQNDMERLRKEKQVATQRQEKLQSILELLDNVEGLVQQLPVQDALNKTLQKLQQFGQTLTVEEQDKLKYGAVIVPAILGSVVQPAVNKWRPTFDPSADKALIESVLLVNVNLPDIHSIRKTMLQQFLLIELKKFFVSSKWDPARDSQAETGLKVYETLLKTLRTVESDIDVTNNTDDQNVLLSEHDRKRTELSDLTKEVLVSGIVLDKLSRSLQEWKPRVENGTLLDPLDHWVLPWLPHLTGDSSIVPTLVGDCKRKIKSALTVLNNKLTDDSAFFRNSMLALLPWRGIFKHDTIASLVSSIVSPRLARSLAKLNSPVLGDLDIVFKLFESRLLSELEFLSVLEGELLPRWALSIHDRLVKKDTVAAKLFGEYRSWKLRFFAPSKDATTCVALLRTDEHICRSFYSVLLLLSSQSNTDLEKARPSLSSNYRVVLARRKLERRRQARDDLRRLNESGTAADNRSDEVEARVRLGDEPTFRDVVEEYAAHKGIFMQPKMGGNTSKDGKQIYTFGKSSIYLDNNVVFVNGKSSRDWQPISLDDLCKL